MRLTSFITATSLLILTVTFSNIAYANVNNMAQLEALNPQTANNVNTPNSNPEPFCAKCFGKSNVAPLEFAPITPANWDESADAISPQMPAVLSFIQRNQTFSTNVQLIPTSDGHAYLYLNGVPTQHAYQRIAVNFIYQPCHVEGTPTPATLDLSNGNVFTIPNSESGIQACVKTSIFNGIKGHMTVTRGPAIVESGTYSNNFTFILSTV